MSNFNIRIFQPLVPEYRAALFDRLAERYGSRISVWASERFGRDVSVKLEKMLTDYSHPVLRIGPFLWQRGMSLKGLAKGDVVVVCGDIHQLSSVWLAALARVRGIKVVWWGHHVSAGAKELFVKIRLRVAKCLADVMLCYTDEGIRYLLARGFAAGRVFATGNTVDLDAVEEARSEWTVERLSQFKSANRLSDGRVLFFCGVIRGKSQMPVLLRALKRLREGRTWRDVKLVVVGAGEEFDKCKDLARELGLEECVVWCGEVRGQRKLAPWFMSADLFVYPGSIGLSLIHAFAYGLPVVLNDDATNHGPEYVVFSPGRNGFSFKAGDSESLARTLESALSADGLARLGANGQRLVFDKFSMRRMVERYSEAIEAAHDL